MKYITYNFFKKSKELGGNEYCSKNYCKLSGPGYIYLFTPKNDQALKFLLARLRYKKSIKNRFAIQYLKLACHLPKNIVPNVNVKLPKELKDALGELIIISGSRMKCFNFRKRVVFTLPLTTIGRERIKIEVDVRKRFKGKINLPRIVHYDEDVPYLVEEIVGNPLYELNRMSWRLVFDALKQLIKFYKENYIKEIFVEKKIKEISLILMSEKINFKESDFRILESLTKILHELDCKSLLVTLTHGDFYLGNLVTDGKIIYITDWEFPRERLILSDFIYLLFRYYVDTGCIEVLKALLREEIDPHTEYITKILNMFEQSFSIHLKNDIVKCYLILGILERIYLFKSYMKKLIFKRLKRMLPLLK